MVITNVKIADATIRAAKIEKGNIFDLTIDNEIKSFNYVPGVSGLIFKYDGSFELYGGKFRSDIQSDTFDSGISVPVEETQADTDLEGFNITAKEAGIIGNSIRFFIESRRIDQETTTAPFRPIEFYQKDNLVGLISVSYTHLTLPTKA